ncbi:helix-turn-helix transcriptional regulator [Salmonella enterica]|uniref:Transcriptional regulator n=11 Tax=Salmonella enterica TaxID=28901 RepID=A0A379S4J6_SALER|nr:helix-turn-helix transcriptional regulator [Salmonella enterica]EAA0559105.1 XRE family transcriptional regulator [Salmonella enterica subsp. enterica serovar Lexington]EAA6774410.1 XRE family transcriptional regulator [Salmonella enterica subsp. enterica serovar Braenderup]EAT8891055.1 helix-turn-helix transcriptional regulator [Salmonella enterica subsp. arizonae serovar 53:z4,z23,z32:-]EBC9391427.1 XRE family transcriptional regulator [Salmonella enterica subsp. enterica serovar Infantis]
MKVKGVTFDEVRAKALNTPEAQAAYEEAKREAMLFDLLQEMKNQAGINSKQLAERMGVTPPAVTRLEKNPTKASIATLDRYAAACGSHLKISF